MKKITIVGAGGVGSQLAFVASRENLGEIILVDIVPGLPQGKALDIFHTASLINSQIKITGTNDFAKSKNSDVVVITAGLPRKPGMTREDLVLINSKIMKSVISQIIKYSPKCILIIVTNPLDVMVHVAYKLSGFPKNKVLGMSGALDSARLRSYIAEALNVAPKNVTGLVIGNHGDLMVPLLSTCKVNGVPIQKLLPAKDLRLIVEKVRNSGGQIISLLKTGSTIFAPALAILEMVRAIIKDEKKIIPCSVLLRGEYGIDNLFLGVPVVLGKNGCEKIVEIGMTEDEKNQFLKSAEHVKKFFQKP